MSQLAYYTERAKTMTNDALDYAIRDVKATLEIWEHERMSHSYIEKLYAEWDAYTVERHKRISS